jgi:lysophospholipase L1-like esterase
LFWALGALRVMVGSDTHQTVAAPRRSRVVLPGSTQGPPMTDPARWILCLAAGALAVHVVSRAQTAAPVPRTDAPPLEVYKVILVGDSTTAPHSGWGGAFCAHHVKWRIACLNLGRGARSTRSYRSEGAWDIALDEMKVDGYKKVFVLIQMGHNDQARHKPERWTDETTEFPDNLRRFVKETRRAGAVPLLVTPLARREFKDGALNDTLASWSAQVRKVATELKVPLIDLNARSAQLAQKLGPVGAMDLAQAPPSEAEVAAAKNGTTLPTPPSSPAAAEDKVEHVGKSGARAYVTVKFDYTHLGPQGAALTAATIAEELALAAPELAGLLVPAEGLRAAAPAVDDPSRAANVR